ncbi:ABC transporter ATP-binding protein [Stutzerimonas kunmingensis]|uniref:ABC transporter ATP-binding protein n=1 Tax=Stutzerimonas TaxID=2901164 RepID=UPI0037CD8D0F
MGLFSARAEGMPSGMPSNQTDRTMWRWLMTFAAPYWRRFALVLTLSLLVAAGGLAQPYMTKFLIDDGILANRFDLLAWCVAAMAGLALLSSLLGGLTRYIYVEASALVLHGIREAMFAHLLRLSPDFYARTRQGDIHARLEGDISELQRFIIDSLLSLVNNSFLLIGSVLILSWMSGELVALLLIVLGVNAAFLRVMRPRIENLTRQARERGSDIAAFFVEKLGMVKYVQSFNGERREGERLGTLHGALRNATLRLQVAGYIAGAVPGLVLSVSISLVFLVGGYRIGEGSLTLGTLIAFVTYMQRASGPAQSLMGLYVSYQRARVSLARVRELSAESPAVQPPEAAQGVVAEGRGDLRLERVSFGYPGTQRLILQGLDCHVPAGSRVLIRGASGAGKSTLVDLLQRHFDPGQGRILLDGVDLRQQDIPHLRRKVVVVSQDPRLFSGSLLENIRYGCPAASVEQVRAAATAAGLDEFTDLDVDLGQGGSRLSGGQRQRVALARAILLHPAILILDESTSGVEQHLEQQIHREIDRLFADRTRIFISHRPLADERFDIVLELERSRIPEGIA